eukprot:6174218-Heterocapsa_arctica.AAC.1
MVRCGPGPRSSKQCRASIYITMMPSKQYPKPTAQKPKPYAVAGQEPSGYFVFWIFRTNKSEEQGSREPRTKDRNPMYVFPGLSL